MRQYFYYLDDLITYDGNETRGDIPQFEYLHPVSFIVNELARARRLSIR